MFHILLLCTLLPLLLNAAPEISKSYLVIGWFPGCCAVYGMKCQSNQLNWTIHGLMPQMNGNKSENVSPLLKVIAKIESKIKEPTFNNSQVKADPTLLSNLEKKWPSVNPKYNNEQFWKYVWEKNGVHYNHIPSMKQQNDYFLQTMKLYDDLQINEKLSKAIKPSNEEPIDLKAIIDRTTELFKVDVHLKCGERTLSKNAILTHIYFCYDTDLKLISCKNPKRTHCTDKVLLLSNSNVTFDEQKSNGNNGADGKAHEDTTSLPYSAMLSMAKEMNQQQATNNVPKEEPGPQPRIVIVPANFTPDTMEALRSNLTNVVSSANDSITTLQHQFGVLLARVLVMRPANETMVRDITEIIERISHSKHRLNRVSERLRTISTQEEFAEQMTILNTIGVVIEEMVTRLILIIARLSQ